MTRSILPGLVMLALLGTGCGGPKYVPDITLTQTGPIIDATAEFHSLYPADALLSGKDTFGLDAPKAERIQPSELTRQVERELLKELDAAGVFSRVTRFDPHPDVLLSGRITALYEHYRPQVWAKIVDHYVPFMGSIAQLFGIKTHVSNCSGPGQPIARRKIAIVRPCSTPFAKSRTI